MDNAITEPGAISSIDFGARMREDSRSEPARVCSRCVLDSTVADIWFDVDGECQYCKIHDELEKAHPIGDEGRAYLERTADKIKRAGRGKSYDCIVGVSGGRDSTYTLYMAVKLGLRPLAVHFDNGWNSPTAVENIKSATSKLAVDLVTVVADWEEFRDLQLAFLEASVPDAEVPTDYVIHSVLFQAAASEGVRFVLEGHSFRTEGTSPISWSYMDPRYIRAVHKRFGKLRRTDSFPVMGLGRFLFNVFVKRIRVIRVLEYIEYNHEAVGKVLERELGWEYYGGHHHESIYTHFFQSFLLPRKFNIDKRKTECSALVRSGQMTRSDALREIREPYPVVPELVDYTRRKLELSEEEFSRIIDLRPRSYREFPSLARPIRALRHPLRLAAWLNLVPKILYLKYSRSR